MTTVISRHTSTVSLVSQNSVQLEAGLLVQCLNRHKEYLECGCEKVLNSKFLKKGTGLSGLNNPNPSFGDDTADTALSSISGGTGFENITSSVVRRLDAGARESLGQHLIQLLATIVLPDPPQSISEVDTRLVDGLPGIPDKLMPSDSNMESYRNLAEKGRKKMLNLPFDKIFTALKVCVPIFFIWFY
ncbi:putative ras GTP exchange factor, son of sevenless [Schistosoma mansoni]|uniref:putative ras GTP exchange factor, son of sevenless n=1 Tax=Schistosoma mansoni TaxID=6183 RepID=UPI00022DC7FD|nr:putative ras GTP exchange factor, son of sevenless [Schistosoma mansoni]|eukprot:XP_018650373.1 putative ras GTP exchange factor, son of sevenless [Schistosoma mansoni]